MDQKSDPCETLTQPSMNDEATNPSLFVVNPDDLIEEDDTVTPVTIDCQTYVREKLQENNVKIFHPFFGNPAITKWPSRLTDIDCLHCCHPFDTYPIPIPRRYDERLNKYFVYGIFCSINCAKAYILEHEQSISTTRMLNFVHMCRSLFGLREAVKPAPPRIRLKRFMGALTIEEFRQNFKTITSHVDEPPFIHTPLVISETRDKQSETTCQILSGNESKTSESSTNANNMFEQFVQEQKKNHHPMNLVTSTQSASNKKRRTKSAVSASTQNDAANRKTTGNLNDFITFGA